MNLSQLPGMEKPMNFGQLSACVICAILGASAVKLMDTFDSDDVVTAKRMVITDNDGKTVILMDGSGLQVLGEDSDSFTRIKGNERPQIDIVRDGNSVVTLGQNSTGTDGLALYHGGKMAGALTVNDDRTVLGLFTPNSDSSGASSFEDLVSGANGFVYMAARPAKSEMRVSFGDESKSLSVPSEEK